MTMNNGSNMTMMAQAGHHMIKGQISNVEVDSSGKPEWVQSGIWVLRVTLGENNTVVDPAQLIARFSMVKPDGTAMDAHMIYGFRYFQMTFFLASCSYYDDSLIKRQREWSTRIPHAPRFE